MDVLLRTADSQPAPHGAAKAADLIAVALARWLATVDDRPDVRVYANVPKEMPLW